MKKVKKHGLIEEPPASPTIPTASNMFHDQQKRLSELEKELEQERKSSRLWSTISFILIFMLILIAIVLGYIYSQWQVTSADVQQCPAPENVKVLPPSITPSQMQSSSSSCCSKWSVINASRADLFTPRQKRVEAQRLYQQAATFSAEHGEGKQGWLHLLAAYSYDPANKEIVHNLISNYDALQYDSIGYSTLLDSRLSDTDRRHLMAPSRQAQLAASLQQAKTSMEAVDRAKVARLEREDCSSILFATVISRWNLSNTLSSSDILNEAIYTSSIRQYEALQRAHPHLTATDLNHRFFQVQMSDLDVSGTYWGHFQDIPGFVDLVAQMRHAAALYLTQYHGVEGVAARRKAAHPLVVWVSVHTLDSVHQPHVTEDALVGGVYYVSVPRGSAKLHLFDPRGKHPVLDLTVPTSPPRPPFHRLVSLAPAPGLLVLFPGWLVHSVGSVTGSGSSGGIPKKRTGKSGEGGEVKYRVSLSLNLKGEWMDTSSAAFGCPTYRHQDTTTTTEGV